MLRRKRLLSSPRLKKRRREVFLKKALFLALLFGVFFIGSLYIFNSGLISFSQIFVYGGELDKNAIAHLVKDGIDRPRVGIVHSDNFLLIDKTDIVASVKTAFPEVEDVTLSARGVRNLVVNIESRAPVAIWCGQAQPKVCFNIDREGMAFEEAIGVSSTTLPVINTGSAPSLRSVIFEKEKFNRYLDFVKVFKGEKFGVDSLVDYGDDIYIVTKDKVEVRALLNDDPQNVANRFRLILAETESDKSNESIQYVDIRFGSKVFLKKNKKGE